MRFYISGKINKLELQTARINFWAAERELYYLHQVSPLDMVNPLNVKPLFSIDNWLCHMATDIWELLGCTHIALQTNWESSRVARIEKRIADWIGLEVIELTIEAHE